MEDFYTQQQQHNNNNNNNNNKCNTTKVTMNAGDRPKRVRDRGVKRRQRCVSIY
jgi:hypothetical protein